MTANSKPKPMQKAFRNPNFRLLWGGQLTSVLGDQFSMIALPWLVLKLTNDPLALGIVLALSSIPRALFMLVGGAITDRFSQRTVMLTSDILRFALTGLMAALVLTSSVHLWMIYVIALLNGSISSFFTPASSSIVPQMLESEEIQAGNSIMQGSMQLSIFLGPMLAGGLIAAFAGKSTAAGAPDLEGIGLAIAFDSLTYLVSTVTLWFMKVTRPQTGAGQPSLLDSIKEGIHFVLQDPALRLVYILIAAVNLIFVGPLLVGIPVLADTRLPQGAAAFGMIMSAYGGGNLAGILLAGALPHFKPQAVTALLVGLIAAFGGAMFMFAFFATTLPFVVVMLLLGVGNGYLAILLITFMQTNTPKEMIGRVMSLLLFANLGLVPVSQALAGVLLKISINGVFIGAGILMVVVAGGMLLTPDLKIIGQRIGRVETN